jgi:hypothetical protein
MPAAELTLAFDSLEALSREHEANLRHGRAFVRGAQGLALFAPCTLRIVRSDTGAALDLEARVVMVSDREPMRGTAVEMAKGPWRERLEAFVNASATSAVETAPDAAPDAEPILEAVAEPIEETAPEPIVEAEAAAEQNEEEVGDGEGEEAESDGDPKAHDRRRQIRNLSPQDRARVAHSIRLDERVMLERTHGSAVWELLLRSPHVTIPEVARIARKGTLPRPLAELIVDNAQWIRHDIVRRALLTNPRVSADGILKILRASSARELKLIMQQTAYPAQVRAVARKLLGGS